MSKVQGILKFIAILACTIICTMLSSLAFIVMLCNYGQNSALPWAIVAGVMFIIAVVLGLKAGEMRAVK